MINTYCNQIQKMKSLTIACCLYLLVEVICKYEGDKLIPSKDHRHLQTSNSNDPIHKFIIETGENDLLFEGLSIPNNAAEIGMWSPVKDWPMNSIHITILPDGNVMTYGTPINTDLIDGRTFVFWDPKKGFTPESRTVSSNAPGADSFCSSAAFLSDGTLLISGGSSVASGTTSLESSVLDYKTQSTVLSEFELHYPRWYGTMTKLPDGRALITGGADTYTWGAYQDPFLLQELVSTIPEVFTEGRGWEVLPTAAQSDAFGAKHNRYWYPRQWVSPAGTVVGISTDKIWEFSTLTNRTLFKKNFKTKPDDRTTPNVGPTSTAVMYDTGKIIQVGGNGLTNTYPSVSSKRATIVDFNNVNDIKMRDTSNMTFGRQWANSVVLPNGQVLVTGGSQSADDPRMSVFAAEIWNPETESWTVGPSAAKYRGYHSSTALLLNGVVFSGGGGTPGPIAQFNVELYYPSYLFRKVVTNGTSVLASRPKIISISSNTPAYNSSIEVQVSSDSPILKVVFIGTAVVTHSFDSNQRRMTLAFEATGLGLRVRMPSSSNLAPPGYYHLIVLNDKGVPSPAAMIGMNVAAPPAKIRAPTLGQSDTNGGDGTSWKYTEPSWWSIILVHYSDHPVKTCDKRQYPAEPGSKCAGERKICFWFDQQCASLGSSYPKVSCTCHNSQWSCALVPCP